MKIKNRWMYIVFVSVFLPIPTYAQLVNPSDLVSPSKLSGKYDFRFGYARAGYIGYGSFHGIWFAGDLGFGDSTKVSTRTRVFFNSDATIEDIFESFQIVHITPLGATGLDCFFFGDFAFLMDPSYSERYAHLDISDSALQTLSIIHWWLGGGGGLSKTFGPFTVFASLSYHHTLATRYEKSPPRYGLLSTGAEIEITQHIDLTGGIGVLYEPGYGFTASEFYIGFRLH